MSSGSNYDRESLGSGLSEYSLSGHTSARHSPEFSAGESTSDRTVYTPISPVYTPSSPTSVSNTGELGSASPEHSLSDPTAAINSPGAPRSARDRTVYTPISPVDTPSSPTSVSNTGEPGSASPEHSLSDPTAAINSPDAPRSASDRTVYTPISPVYTPSSPTSVSNTGELGSASPEHSLSDPTAAINSPGAPRSASDRTVYTPISPVDTPSSPTSVSNTGEPGSASPEHSLSDPTAAINSPGAPRSASDRTVYTPISPVYTPSSPTSVSNTGELGSASPEHSLSDPTAAINSPGAPRSASDRTVYTPISPVYTPSSPTSVSNTGELGSASPEHSLSDPTAAINSPGAPRSASDRTVYTPISPVDTPSSPTSVSNTGEPGSASPEHSLSDPTAAINSPGAPRSASDRTVYTPISPVYTPSSPTSVSNTGEPGSASPEYSLSDPTAAINSPDAPRSASDRTVYTPISPVYTPSSPTSVSNTGEPGSASPEYSLSDPTAAINSPDAPRSASDRTVYTPISPVYTPSSPTSVSNTGEPGSASPEYSLSDPTAAINSPDAPRSASDRTVYTPISPVYTPSSPTSVSNTGEPGSASPEYSLSDPTAAGNSPEYSPGAPEYSLRPGAPRSGSESPLYFPWSPVSPEYAPSSPAPSSPAPASEGAYVYSPSSPSYRPQLAPASSSDFSTGGPTSANSPQYSAEPVSSPLYSFEEDSGPSLSPFDPSDPDPSDPEPSEQESSSSAMEASEDTSNDRRSPVFRYSPMRLVTPSTSQQQHDNTNQQSVDEPTPTGSLVRTSEGPEPLSKIQRVECDPNLDGETCPICLDVWTNSGPHRLVSLKCGHLFGRSCLERWLKAKPLRERCCPTCKAKANIKEIRNIFARRLVAADSSEVTVLQSRVEQLQAEKSRVELELQKTKISHRACVTQLEGLRATLMGARGQPEAPMRRHWRFALEKNLEISRDSGCRVLTYNCRTYELYVSQQSANNIFPGYGVRKVSCVDYQPGQFVHLHSKSIRDMTYSTQRDLLLTVGLDNAAKVMERGILSANIQAGFPLWSCSWDYLRTNEFYVGGIGGQILQYDIRNHSTHLQRLVVESDVSPVASLKSTEHGLLSCQLNSCWLWVTTDRLVGAHGQYEPRSLPVDGPFMSLTYDAESHRALVACRPLSDGARSRLACCTLRTQGSTGEVLVDHQQTFPGSVRTNLMSRPAWVKAPGACWAATHSESECHLYLHGVDGARTMALPVVQPVVDVLALQLHDDTVLAALSQQRLRLYKAMPANT